MVKATAGKKGFCVLSRKSKDISLLDIYYSLGAPIVFTVHGYPAFGACQVSCHIKPAMKKVVVRVQNSLEKTLKEITLQDLVKEIKSK